MENADPINHSERIHRRSTNSHISMSDTEVDSWHSPLRSDSPLRPDPPENDEKNNMAIVPVDKYYSPVPSPAKGRRPWPHSGKPTSENPESPETPPADEAKHGRRQHQPAAENLDFPASGAAPAVVVGRVNKMVREEPPPPEVRKVGRGDGRLEEGYGGGEEVGGERRSRAAVPEILKRSERSVGVGKVALGIRVFEVIACLISFSVMAADRTQGWSGDSFDRYVEYRYLVAVNVICFVYSAFQTFDLSYHLATGKHLIAHHLRYHFDFAMDQIMSYMLMSASSSAATRVDDWVSNWGGDEFTLMATAAISMSFLAFIAFASSSLISGYNLCNRDST